MLCVMPSVAQDGIAPDKLAIWLRFDEAKPGVVAKRDDSIGAIRNGHYIADHAPLGKDASVQLTGDAKITPLGKIGGALLLDKTAPWNETGPYAFSEIAPAGNPKCALSMWFNASDVDRETPQILYEEGGAHLQLAVYIKNGKLCAYIQSDGVAGSPRLLPGTTLSTDRIESGKWHHLVVVMDTDPNSDEPQDDAILGYLDGELFAKGRAVRQGIRVYIGVGAMHRTVQLGPGKGMGAAKKNGWFSFTGMIDDIRFYNGVAPTAAQVKAFYVGQSLRE